MTATGRRRIGPPIVLVLVFAMGVIGTAAGLSGSLGLVAVLVLGVVIVGVSAWAAARPRQAPPTTAPNELRPDPVADRLDAFFERIDRLPTDRLDMLAVKPRDPAAHRSAVDRALAAVARLHRKQVLQRADEAIERDLPRRLSARSDYFVSGMMTAGTSLMPRDRVRLVATLRDAALAIVAGDALDAETFDELVGPCAELLERLARAG